MSLERCFSQPQSVGNHGYRTKAHRRAREHRTQQPARKMIENAGGNRDSNRVVEKCKSKILLDVANGGAAQFSRSYDSPQVTLEKGDARTFNRHIRPRAHGYAHVRRSQCRRVIDAIPRHRDDSPVRVKPLYDFTIALWPYFGLNFLDSQLTGDALRGCLQIACKHHDTNSLFA